MRPQEQLNKEPGHQEGEKEERRVQGRLGDQLPGRVSLQASQLFLHFSVFVHSDSKL